MSYLEEYDQRKRNSSFHKYPEIIEEDIQIRSGASRSNRKLSKSDSGDDIVDEVTSIVEESIRDEVIDVSGSGKFGKITQSETFKNKAFDDFKTKGYRDAKNDTNAMTQFLGQIQKAINSERN